MKKNNFPFEHITLIMTRDCNLKCEYCSLNHTKINITNEILDIFFRKIIKYNNYNLNITLFWWEPLLNKKWIEHIYVLLKKYMKEFIGNNIFIYLKIPSNGTLLNNDYIKLFNKIKSLNFINLSFNISIDWDKTTQLRQRNYAKKNLDYYEILKENIKMLVLNNFDVELSTVLAFSNDNFFDDIVYLIKKFKLPIFLMPMQLTSGYIVECENINNHIKKYLINIERTLKLIKINKLDRFIINFSSYVDVVTPSIGPTVDVNGDIYTTRSFMFSLDRSEKFFKIWNIKKMDLVNYFIDNDIKKIEFESFKLFYWKTFLINKSIWDFFTNLIYSK